jgi:hypothetical protein
MKYYLHYVGGKLYPKETFIKEAEQFGVNRCIPMRMIKKLKWGDKILLGIFSPKELTPIMAQSVFDGRKNKTGGRAEVFGYFIITGLNINASQEFKTTLIGQLDIVESKEQNLKIQRQCGSYVLGTSYVVKDCIEDIIKKAEQLQKDFHDFGIEKVKFFLAGYFKPLTLTIEPINFTRTLIPVEIETELELGDLNFLKEVGLIYDYDKRSYIKKQEKRGRPRKEKK